MSQLIKRKLNKLVEILIIVSIVLGAILLVDSQQTLSFASQRYSQTSPTESLTPSINTWNLSEIYSDTKSIETEIMAIRTDLLPKLSDYAGELSKPLMLKEFLLLDEQAKFRIQKAYCYAVLSKDLKHQSKEATVLVELVDELYYEYYGAVYFAENEIKSMSNDTLNALITHPELIEYKRYLEKLREQLSHNLNAEAEMSLAQMRINYGDPRMRFNMITSTEYKSPVIKTHDGKNLTLTASIYNACVTSRDRELRKIAYEAAMASFKKQVNGLASNYANQLALDNFSAKSRGYHSSLEASLADNELSMDCYNQLIEGVSSNLKSLHKYYEIRKKYLGLEQMYSYDVMVPIVDEINYKFSYESAVKVLNNALDPLGSYYLKNLNNGLKSNWIHVLPQKSDLKGNYLWNAYDVHPYILLKYDEHLQDVLTLNRAMASGMNKFYSNQSQRYLYANVPNGTEQVAEYVNDLLLMKYFIEHSSTDQQKLFFINYQIQSIKKVIFDNALNAEFEQKSHELAELNGRLSAEELNKLWLNLVKKYGGKSLIVPDEGKYTWSRIETFYTPYKSYLSALNLSAAYTIVNKLSTSKSEVGSDEYLNYLRSGDSLKPVESLKLTGVDLESTETTENIINYFAELVNEYERLLMASKSESKTSK